MTPKVMANQPKTTPSELLRVPLVQRVLLFVLAFVLISGISGSWLISTQKLLFPFYFAIYGSAGKSLLFGVVTFLLLTKDSIMTVQVEKWKRVHALCAGISVASMAAFFILAHQLLQFKTFADAPFLAVATHASLVIAGLTITLAVFGWTFLRQLSVRYWKELTISFTLSVIFYFLFGWIFMLWPYLSKIVLVSVGYLLHFTVPNLLIIPPLTIQLPQFAITVGEYCSGIESLFLITTLYLLIGCLERERLRTFRFIFLYFPLIIGMFGLNIVRVYVIILSGLWLGPEIAGKLFHNYLGMILFMGYFFIFWKMAAPILIRERLTKDKERS